MLATDSVNVKNEFPGFYEGYPEHHGDDQHGNGKLNIYAPSG
jgi:hypothetical protein